MRGTPIAWFRIISTWLVAIVGMTFCARAFGADSSPREMLEAIARDPMRASSPADIDALAMTSDALDDGALRNTIDLFVGEAFRGRLGAPARAKKHFTRVLASPHADGVSKRMAAGGLVDVLIATGEPTEALARARESNDGDLVARARVAVSRERAHWLSVCSLSVFAFLAAVAVVRAARGERLAAAWPSLRIFIIRALFFGTWLGGAGAVLARAYDTSDPGPFLRLALAAVVLLIVTRAWALAGSSTRPARWLRAAFAVEASFAAAFLALESVDPRLLASFGL